MANSSYRASFLARAMTAAVSTVLLVPVPALAEESAGGITLLVPALAELIPATIAFIIIFIVMSKLVWPTVVKMMDDRENKILNDISAAEKAREEAEADAKNYKDQIAAAEREAADIIAEAKRRAEEERAQILAEAQRDAAATVARGKDVVETERKRAMEDLSRSVIDLSVEIAGKIIGNDLSDDEHRALAAKYLQEVGKSDAR